MRRRGFRHPCWNPECDDWHPTEYERDRINAQADAVNEAAKAAPDEFGPFYLVRSQIVGFDASSATASC